MEKVMMSKTGKMGLGRVRIKSDRNQNPDV